MPDATRGPVVTEYASVDAFARSFFAHRDVCHAVWPALEDGTAIVLVDDWVECEACGAQYAPARKTRALVGDVAVGLGDRDVDAFLVKDGASLWELYDVACKLDRMQDRERDARFRSTDEDLDEIERVVATLEERLQDRRPMDTAFAQHWIPKQTVERVFVRTDVDESEYRSAYSFKQQGLV